MPGVLLEQLRDPYERLGSQLRAPPCRALLQGQQVSPPEVAAQQEAKLQRQLRGVRHLLLLLLLLHVLLRI